MNKTPYTVGVALILCASLALNWKQYTDAKDQRLKFEQDASGLNDRLTRTEKALASAKESQNISRRAEVAVVNQQAAAAPAQLPQKQAPTQDPALLAKKEALRRMDRKAQFDLTYGDLFRRLKLNPEEVEKLKDLLIARQDASKDIDELAKQFNIDRATNPKAYQDLVQRVMGEREQEVRALLGDKNFVQYVEFNQATAQRAIVVPLKVALSYGEAPLTDEQSDRLVALMKQEKPGPGAVTPNDQTVAQAAEFLGPQQLSALRQIQTQNRVRSELRSLESSPGSGARPGDGR